MADPTNGGSSRARHRANADRRLGKAPMTADDSLMVEAYGTKGAAMRKTAAVFGEAVEKSDSDSTLVQKGVARVKKLFGK